MWPLDVIFFFSIGIFFPLSSYSDDVRTTLSLQLGPALDVSTFPDSVVKEVGPGVGLGWREGGGKGPLRF